MYIFNKLSFYIITIEWQIRSVFRLCRVVIVKCLLVQCSTSTYMVFYLMADIVSLLISVERIRGHWPQAPLGDRAKASTIQNEDLLSRPYCRKIPFLVFLATTEEVQENYRWNCFYQGLSSYLIWWNIVSLSIFHFFMTYHSLILWN